MSDLSLPSLRMVPPGLAVWEWPGHRSPLLFAHATGFHGRVWDHVVRLFPGRHSLAIEFSGHGRSRKPNPPIPWRTFAEDVLAVARHYSPRGVIGIGHSMGGHALAAAAGLSPETFGSLVLVDPVILPAEQYGAQPLDAAFIQRRRNRFGSAQEMFERFRPRAPFSTWSEDVLRSYCEYGLVPDSSDYILACPPPTEAAIYALSNAPESNIYPLISTIQIPVTVLRAGRGAVPGPFDPTASPTAHDLPSRFPNCKETVPANNTHFIPMESPETVADAIRSAIAGVTDVS
jgi:pimeloyl-ACP methyl ester carboxylesterase